MAITIDDYFALHLKGHESELTDTIRANATETVARVNRLLEAAALDGVVATIDTVSHTIVGSGWRPQGVNAATRNAAANSTHLTGEACDIRDDPKTRMLARWALSPKGRDSLVKIGLWCERPMWTPSWLHVQTRPPRSGFRFYIPSTASPLAEALPGEAL